MSIKNIIIKIFGDEEKELTTGVETWVVKWYRIELAYRSMDGAYIEPSYQAFTSKTEADEFADALRKAHKLLGNKDCTKIYVDKQEKVGL